MIHIVYHKACMDGFGAAFAAWLAINTLGGKVQYHAMQYGDRLPEPVALATSDDEVYFLDFSIDPHTLMTLAGQAKKVTIIDHHKSAIEKLEGFEHPKVDLILDTNHSGAVLAYRHFFPKTHGWVPMFFEYIEDRDLWKWKMPQSREFSAALSSYPYDFKVWKELLDSQQHASLWNLPSEGKAILRHINQVVDNLSKKATIQRYATPDWKYYDVPVVNATSYQSEVCHKLLELHPGAPFVATFFLDTEGQFIWSLRSEDNRIDVLEIAEQFGGGGHRNASGFRGVWEKPKE